MIKHLFIQNIILVEKAELHFQTGLNVLTGETGSGKSAIMHGLNLVLGERADTSLIRRECEKGSVEAVFEIEHPAIWSLLNEGGIDCEVGQELIIRREITRSGKGRIFINHQSSQLAFLRSIGRLLAQIIGQHANQSLFLVDTHRQMIDLYGNLRPLLSQFQRSFEAEIQLKAQLNDLLQRETSRVREIDICQQELQELQEAQIKEGEEEILFAEYSLLNHAEEISSKIQELNFALTGEKQPILIKLNKQKQLLDSLSAFDPLLQEVAQGFQNICLELQEISITLQHYQSKMHFNPERLYQVNERLTLLNRLKRKYGQSVAEILDYQKQTELKLHRLENADIEIENLQKQLIEIEKETRQWAQELTSKRHFFAEEFEKGITSQLHSLNMPQAAFFAKIYPQVRNREGEESIEFYLRPNLGENQVALKNGASGGEISRVLLALQTVLGGKEQVGTLIFDEVDANIGGETATIVGDKLRQISRQHQVICITHFPQVASQADHHHQITKEEKEGRTFTLVKELDFEGREVELARMAGLKVPSPFCGLTK